MAKAVAKCTCATCGREFTYEKTCFTRRDADVFEEWAAANITECSECREKRLREEQNAENAKAAALAAENGLPKLSGSEKQVAWAMTLRQRAIDVWMEKGDEKSRDFMMYILEHATKASEWIDARDDNAKFILASIARKYRDAFKSQSTIKNPQDEVSMRDVENEKLITPENASGVTVDIIRKEQAIQLRTERDDRFIRLVKGYDYRWNAEDRVWEHGLGVMRGSFEDRAAEIGHVLLKNGFPVRIDDADVRQNAIEGKYEPECKFWILKDAAAGKLAICMNERSEERYQAARRLPGAQYVDGEILVSPEHYEKVRKFAEKYGFKISEKAQAMMDEIQNRPVTKIN